MANIYDWLGAQDDYFQKSGWQVHNNSSGSLQYVGKTENEVTFSPNLELAEWFDNSTGVQFLYAIGISKFDLMINFMFKQILDPNVISIGWNADLDTSDANFNYLFFGTDPNDLGEYEWRWVGKSKSGLSITFVVRKGIAVPNGDWATGAPGEWTSFPISIRTVQDTTITNTKRDLAYFMIQKRALS